jgi:hypothetical protein
MRQGTYAHFALERPGPWGGAPSIVFPRTGVGGLAIGGWLMRLTGMPTR